MKSFQIITVVSKEEENMCICETCDCRTSCIFYGDNVQPVKEIVELEYAGSQFSSEPVDPYIKALAGALEVLKCEYYEEEQK